jgi:hypothetical protein
VAVRRTVSDGVVVELGKTSASRRQVPTSRRALAALEELPPRLDTPLLFPAPSGRLLNLDNFRRREWAPAVQASGVTVFELARIMGTSVRMIERHYGAFLDGAGAGIARRLDTLEAELEQQGDELVDDV